MLRKGRTMSIRDESMERGAGHPVPASAGVAQVWSFVTEYSFLPVAGAAVALAWANLDPAS